VFQLGYATNGRTLRYRKQLKREFLFTRAGSHIFNKLIYENLELGPGIFHSDILPMIFRNLCIEIGIGHMDPTVKLFKSILMKHQLFDH